MYKCWSIQLILTTLKYHPYFLISSKVLHLGTSVLLWKIHWWNLRGLYLTFCGYYLIFSSSTSVFSTKTFLPFTVYRTNCLSKANISLGWHLKRGLDGKPIIKMEPKYKLLTCAFLCTFLVQRTDICIYSKDIQYHIIGQCLEK